MRFANRVNRVNGVKMAADIIYSCAPSEVSNVCVQVRSLNEGSMLKNYKGSSTDDRVGYIAVAGSHFLLGTMQTKPFIVVWALQKVSLTCFHAVFGSACIVSPPWGQYPPKDLNRLRLAASSVIHMPLILN